jgi:phosphatidate cytidylyltransferase
VLRTRVWTAAAILPAILAATLFSNPTLFSYFIGALAGWGLQEIASVRRASTAYDFITIFGVGGLLAALALDGFEIGGWLPVLVAAAMTAIVARVGFFGSDRPVKDGLLNLIGAVYVGGLFPYFALLRNRPHGVAAMILMLALVIASDSGAYFAGRSLGRIKLLPRVSPNKTVEGALGGLVAAAIVGSAIGPWLAPSLNSLQVLVFSSIIAGLAQLGDLAGSAYKRVCGVKDFGWIFPGHGGLLDRACSLVFAAAFTYYRMQ